MKCFFIYLSSSSFKQQTRTHKQNGHYHQNHQYRQDQRSQGPQAIHRPANRIHSTNSRGISQGHSTTQRNDPRTPELSEQLRLEVSRGVVPERPHELRQTTHRTTTIQHFSPERSDLQRRTQPTRTLSQDARHEQTTKKDNDSQNPRHHQTCQRDGTTT